MGIQVPHKISEGFDKILKSIADQRLIKGYKFLIGNPDGAFLAGFDDSDWNFSEDAVKFKRHQGITWFRFDVKIPEKIMDIPLEGSAVRISSFFLSPTDIYINGELKLSERTWADFKVPEIILTGKPVPGQVFKVAVKLELMDHCYFDGQFLMNFIAGSVEDQEFEIASFKEELAYACRFEEVREILPQVFDMLGGSLDKEEGILTLVEKIRISRDMLKPMETEAKKRTVHLVGHAHIDMNWFWSMDETLDIIKRDFGTMTQIMEEMPDFKFSQSQCATYEMTEKNYPGLFDKIKKFISSGNWDVTASAWVEGDMNMASGESIVRQIIYSKKYLKEKFGIEPRVSWNPDTFGHSANLPQIAKKGGIDYYFFGRCAEESTDYGADFAAFALYGSEKPVFWWEGLDGSRILAYTKYGSEINTACILNISTKLQHKFGLDNSMYVYGTGDHGGGPTRRDIRRAKQLESYPTTPKIEFSTSHKFYDSVVNEKKPGIPVVKGEMNFIFDGCYTTHADTKKYNRASENNLVNTEIMGTISSLYGGLYDRDKLEQCWKTALFNQFHDIFDGSGVELTYKYSAEIAQKLLAELSDMTDKFSGDIASKLKLSRRGRPYLVFNTTGWSRSECIKLQVPDGERKDYIAIDSEGRSLTTQKGSDEVYVFVEDVPPVGYKVIYLEEGEVSAKSEKIKVNGDFYEIETSFYFIEISKKSGEITSLYDKINKRYIVRREQVGWKLKNGVLNTLQIYYEVPAPASSWTISTPGRIKNIVSGARTSIKEDGDVVSIINFKHDIDNSTLSQDIVIYNNSRRIDFVTHVDWNEFGDSEKEAPMLKACFIPDIDNSCATYEIPFGAVERLCKDMEVPALKWVDISDENYGFSLLNDCKYGHKVRGNTMEITLIRSGWEPDPKSDVGSHDFIYSIMPHKGNWKESGIIKEGFSLNNGLFIRSVDKTADGILPEKATFIEVSNPNVAIASFKRAEEGEGLILRLYEGAGIASAMKVNLGFNILKVEEVDFNESKIFSMPECNEKSFEANMGSFEIKTFKLYLK